MNKLKILLIIFVLLFCCSCSGIDLNNIDMDDTTIIIFDATDDCPEDFNTQYAKSAVANYYLYQFVMIDANQDIRYIGYNKENEWAVFYVSDSVKEITGDSDLRVGAFYVMKTVDGYYVARSADSTEMKRGTYYPEEMIANMNSTIIEN